MNRLFIGVRQSMQLLKILQFSKQFGKPLAFVSAIVCAFISCTNKVTIALPKGPARMQPASPAAPAAPDAPKQPASPFSAKYVLSARQETFLKARPLDSANLPAAEKCAISVGSQIALESPPDVVLGQHWRVELQLSLPGCALVVGYLFADHWKKVEVAPVVPSDPCGLPNGLDYDLAQRLASEAQKINIGRFTGRCYEYAGMAIENVGIMPKGPDAWRALGVPVVSAADFVQVESSSASNRFARIRPPSWACLPVGAIVVWDRGVCGFNATHGHIEVVVSRRPAYPSETLLCSDGCQTLQTRCSINSGVAIYMPRK